MKNDRGRLDGYHGWGRALRARAAVERPDGADVRSSGRQTMTRFMIERSIWLADDRKLEHLVER